MTVEFPSVAPFIRNNNFERKKKTLFTATWELINVCTFANVEDAHVTKVDDDGEMEEKKRSDEAKQWTDVLS